MAFPRRFYTAFFLSTFSVITYFFLGKYDYAYSFSPASSNAPFPTDGNELVVPDSVAPVLEYDTAGVKITDPAGFSPHDTHSQSAGTPNEAAPQAAAGGQSQGGVTGEERRGKLRISIVESGGSHDEVTAALVYAFGNQPNVELSLFLLAQRYGINDILSNFTLASPDTIASVNSTQQFIKSPNDFPSPQILVSTTCELDLLFLGAPFGDLVHKGETYLFCVVHHADRWAPGRGAGIADHIKPWIDKRMVDFVTLSPHTAQHLRTASIERWQYSDNGVKVRTLPPLFPVAIPEPDENFDLSNGVSLAMQGDYSPDRRNYSSVFEHLGSVNKKVKHLTGGNGTVDLHLIGHGDLPEVPSDVKEQTKFDQGLSYPNFYSLMSRQFAVLPAFASDTYFDRKASSTIPAALIAGAPLVASQKLLDAYSYLPKEAVWISREGETEMHVIERAMDNAHDYVDKRKAAKKACRDLIDNNVVLVKDWIAQGLARVQEVGNGPV